MFLKTHSSFESTVLDRNDNRPVFSEDAYAFSVEENTAQLPGFNVSAEDIDSGSNGMIVFDIIDGNEESTFVLGELSD